MKLREQTHPIKGYVLTPVTAEDERLLFGFLMLDRNVNNFDDESLAALDTINPELDVDESMDFLSHEIASDSMFNDDDGN